MLLGFFLDVSWDEGQDFAEPGPSASAVYNDVTDELHPL